MDCANERELEVIEGALNLACIIIIGKAGTVKKANRKSSEVVEIRKYSKESEIVQNEIKALY